MIFFDKGEYEGEFMLNIREDRNWLVERYFFYLY